MKIRRKTETGSIVSFDYDSEVAEITGLTTSFEPKQDGTPWMAPAVDTAPYLLRQSPDFDHEHNSEIDTLVGGTTAWNQQIKNGDFTNGTNEWGIGSNATATVSNGVLTATKKNASPAGNQFVAQSSASVSSGTGPVIPVGHKALWSAYLASDDLVAYLQFTKVSPYSLIINKTLTITASLAPYSGVILNNGSYDIDRIAFVFDNKNNLKIKSPQLIDLTAMFGTEIADYVYGLEQATAGSGIAWLKSYGFLTKDYYAYDTGSLVSVKTSEHRTTGKNLLPLPSNTITDSGLTITVVDDEKLHISGTTNRSYAINIKSLYLQKGVSYTLTGGTSNIKFRIYGTSSFGDYIGADTGDGFTFTPNNSKTYYFAIGFENGYAVNADFYPMIRYASVSDATYEPYESHSYPLGNDDLRGLFKLSNGNLYADGDVKTSDGQIQRKWKQEIDLGTLTYQSRETTAQGLFLATVPSDYKYSKWVKGICSKYLYNRTVSSTATAAEEIGNKGCGLYYSDGIAAYTYPYLYICDTSLSGYTPEQVASALSGEKITYELATPTTETADPFASPQIVDPNGTEEYVDTRDVPVPVGHRTTYMLPYPISGWDEVKATRTGKNWLKNGPLTYTANGLTFVCNDDGSVSVSGTPTATTDYYFVGAAGVYQNSGIKTGRYTVSLSDSTIGLNLLVVEEGGTIVANEDTGPRSFDLDENKKYRIFFRVSTGQEWNVTVYPMMRLASDTDTTYEPYKSDTYTINLNGTRYGGTIDFFSGVLTLDKGYVTLNGSESWVASGANGYAITRTNAGITDVKVASSANTWCISNLFEKSGTTWTNKRFGIDNGTIWVGDTNFAIYGSLSNFKASLSHENLKIVYELATPLEVQLTAEQIEALQGQNNVWANCGDITLSWLYAPVLSEAVKLNGKYIELIVDGYTTLGTSGRRSLERDLTTYSVGTADGETVKDSVFPSRVITVDYVIQTDTEEELTEAINQLANILNQDECDFVFRDESDKYFSGYALLDSEPKKYRNAIKGSWSIYCAYPFKRSIDLIELSSKDANVASSEAHSATFMFDYKGTLPAHPVLRAEFASAKSGGEYNEDGDCGYVAFLDAEENIIQLGNPEVLDVDQYANETLINREFTSLTGWTANGVTVGDIKDQFWEGGKGQTQSYAKGTGSLTKSVTGAVDMEFDIVHRLCVSAANQTGKFECYAKNGNDIIVGFKIEKAGNGTAGTVSYILNNKVVGTDSIDLSYYNTHFGYCNRTARYVTQTYSVKETYYVKKKGKKKKKKTRWVTKTRQVQNGWNYTQSNLNSGWSKDGGVVVFSIGNLADRTFKSSDIELTPSTSVVFGFTGSLHTNAVHSCAMLSKAGVPFAEIPNVFTAGDVVEGDCNSADVILYRAGSLEGHLEPQYGALGNDWEDFEIKPGRNIIRAVWSDWVNVNYKPTIKIIFNEVYL